MSSTARTPTAPAGVHTFTLPSLPDEQGRHFALVTRTKDWRLLLVRADLSEQEKGDGRAQKVEAEISGYCGCEQLELPHGEMYYSEEGHQLILLQELDAHQNKSPYVLAMIEEGILQDFGARALYPSIKDQVEYREEAIFDFIHADPDSPASQPEHFHLPAVDDPTSWPPHLLRLPYFILRIPSTAVSRECAHCHKLEVQQPVGAPRFKVCGKCLKVAYCSRECQLAEWLASPGPKASKIRGVHRIECRLFRQAYLDSSAQPRAFETREKYEREMNLISALPSQEEGAVASRREEGSSDASGEGEAQIKEGFALRVQRLMQLKEREKELGLGEGQGLGRATIDGVKIWFVS